MARKPAVAGMFYPFGSETLERTLSGLFSGTKAGDFTCVVSPHAGYEYSGRTAAFAIKSLRPAETFVVLGPNHSALGHEFSIMSSGEWITPMGAIEIDSKLAAELKTCKVLGEDELAHVREHSIEVQLPFLQHRFKNFRFVPISITNADYSGDFMDKCVILGKHMAESIKGKSACIIASSDFSHYLPAKIADGKDAKALEKIAMLDIAGFFRVLEKTDASVCGYGPIAVVMSAAKTMGMKGAMVISHTNSGDATGDYASVVSYYAIGFK